jgi:hypothetical protein
LERIGNHHPHLSDSFVLFSSGKDKLVEAGGFFKLEPLKSIDMEILHNFGLVNVESLESNEVELNLFSHGNLQSVLQQIYFLQRHLQRCRN